MSATSLAPNRLQISSILCTGATCGKTGQLSTNMSVITLMCSLPKPFRSKAKKSTCLCPRWRNFSSRWQPKLKTGNSNQVRPSEPRDWSASDPLPLSFRDRCRFFHLAHFSPVSYFCSVQESLSRVATPTSFASTSRTPCSAREPTCSARFGELISLLCWCSTAQQRKSCAS